MPSSTPFHVHDLQVSLRFIQGYRYLDRCGEALVKLENVLEAGWLTTETSPKAGSLKNDQLGMTVSFNSEAMTTHQFDFISFDHFLDQTCKVFDTLWQAFEIKRINLPSIRVALQKGFNDGELDQASKYLNDLKLCTPHPGLIGLLGGQLGAIDFVLVTNEDLNWKQVPVHQRRRLQSQAMRQEKQLPFDERLFRRTRLLGDRQRDAIQALLKIRRGFQGIAPVAAQLDLEHSFETEFSAESFDMPGFLQQGWNWTESIRDGIHRLEIERK